MEAHIKRFNWALLLGCCAIALSIYIVGNNIANRIPHTMHGSFHGSLMDGSVNEQEFMSEWQAALFLTIDYETLNRLVEAGELAGTYTIFQEYRVVWHTPAWWYADDGERQLRMEQMEQSGMAPMPVVPVPQEAEWVLFDTRVFSRERLTEWLLNRMDS